MGVWFPDILRSGTPFRVTGLFPKPFFMAIVGEHDGLKGSKVLLSEIVAIFDLIHGHPIARQGAVLRTPRTRSSWQARYLKTPVKKVTETWVKHGFTHVLCVFFSVVRAMLGENLAHARTTLSSLCACSRHFVRVRRFLQRVCAEILTRDLSHAAENIGGSCKTGGKASTKDTG